MTITRESERRRRLCARQRSTQRRTRNAHIRNHAHLERKNHGELSKQSIAYIKGLYEKLELMLIDGLPGPRIARVVVPPEETACPVLVLLLMNQAMQLTRAPMCIEAQMHLAVHTPHTAWIWDKRRTKSATEARAIQKALIAVVDITRQYLEDKIPFAEIPQKTAD